MYGYAQNLQGDIGQIIDANGAVVVEYTYDAWGKVLNVTGSMAGTLGEIQPFRYREYYSYSDRSGDCANFVSQCLYEGGLPMTSEWNVIREKLDDIGVIEAINHNWANFFYVTRAWSSVNPLYEYLINNYSEGVIEITEGTDLEALQERYGVQVGDVMFFDADGDGIGSKSTFRELCIYISGGVRFDLSIAAKMRALAFFEKVYSFCICFCIG